MEPVSFFDLLFAVLVTRMETDSLGWAIKKREI